MRIVLSAGGLLFLFIAYGCLITDPVPPDVMVSNENLTLTFNGESRELELSCAGKGIVLDRGILTMPSAEGLLHVGRDAALPVMTFGFSGGREAAIRLEGNRLFLSASDRIELTFHGAVHPDSVAAFLKDQKDKDHDVLVTTLGPASIPGADSLYDPHHDLALTAQASNNTKWHFEGTWRLKAEGDAGNDVVMLTITENYYRNELAIAYFQPFEKQSFWNTAPVVAMTWYGVCGMKQPQNLTVLKPEIDWVAEHLLPYAGDIVFQLDDNYDHSDDAQMRAFSDYIRSKGLIPGIWFTPFSIAPEEAYKARPEWFLHDREGKRLHSFAGLNWKWLARGQQAGVLDVESAGAVENWFAMYGKKVSDRWNFDFFKIDGQPTAVAAYRRAVGEQGVQSYRKGLELGRKIVGPDKFINGCWGMPIEGAGIMNGSRTGGDTGYHGHAVNVIIGKNYLNNMVWWCDPDAAAVLHDEPVEKVRLNAQARALTGQQFLTDDLWTQVRAENIEVWQRSFPMLPIRPANLYPVDDEWAAYDLFDLRIFKTWGSYDLAGLHNYQDRPCNKRLDLGRLPLEAGEVHLFEYWSSTYMGRFMACEVLDLAFKPHEGKLFTLVPVSDGRPVLLSTNRHISQGGLDVEAMEWQRHGKGWMVRGRSSHLVAGDPYELVFACSRYQVQKGESRNGKVVVENEPGLARVRIVPEEGGAADWQVLFDLIRGPSISTSRIGCDLAPGESNRVKILSLGNEGLNWRAVSSHPRIEIHEAEGMVGAWPEQGVLSLTADGSGLPPGEVWSGYVDIFEQGSSKSLLSLPVRVHTPLPENLALKANATASSKCDDSSTYAAGSIMDGRPETRWNSAPSDENGCWVLITWPEPVTFNRVILDECIDFGLRIQAWRLETDHTIAQGKEMGSRCVVSLPAPVTANNLKLILEKAKVTPTIREIEIYLWENH